MLAMSSFSAALLVPSRPVGIRKDAKRCGRSCRKPLIMAASASRVQPTCSAKASMWGQFCVLIAPSKVSCQQILEPKALILKKRAFNPCEIYEDRPFCRMCQ